MILAMDCSHDSCSVAVVDDGKTLAARTVDMARGQAEALIPMIKETMKSAGKSFTDLTGIAVSTGPGSFTGVRVGLAAANGLAMAAGLPEAGVSVTEALAFKANFAERLCVVLETKRDDFYAQIFNGGKPETEPFVTDGVILATLTDTVFAGNGVVRLIEEQGDLPTLDIAMPTAEDFARLAETKTFERKNPEPLYLRDAEVTLCRK